MTIKDFKDYVNEEFGPDNEDLEIFVDDGSCLCEISKINLWTKVNKDNYFVVLTIPNDNEEEG